MNKIKFLIITVFMLLPFFSFAPKVWAEDIFQQACSTGNSADSPTCQQAAEQNNPNAENPVSGPKGTIQAAANVFALVTVLAGLILIAYSAFMFASAGGQRAGESSTRARQARTTLVSALGGIIVVSLAWIIVTLINTRINHP